MGAKLFLVPSTVLFFGSEKGEKGWGGWVVVGWVVMVVLPLLVVLVLVQVVVVVVGAWWWWWGSGSGFVLCV